MAKGAIIPLLEHAPDGSIRYVMPDGAPLHVAHRAIPVSEAVDSIDRTEWLVAHLACLDCEEQWAGIAPEAAVDAYNLECFACGSRRSAPIFHAVCMSCGHEHNSAAPRSAAVVECPKCHEMAAVPACASGAK